MDDMILYLSAILVSGYGALTDFKYHKIYNKLTLPAALMGIILNVLVKGPIGVLGSLLGILTGCLFCPLWILGMLKAGDVKLYIAVGALAGWRFCGYTMIFSVLLGGVAGTLLLIVRKTGLASLKRLKEYLLQLLYTKKFYMYQPLEKSAYFCFGGCIFGGSLAAAWRLLS